MNNHNQDSTGIELKKVVRFFNRKRSKYILLVLDDERMLNYLIISIRIDLEKRKKEILNLKLSDAKDESSVYQQVKKFLEKKKCDGLIITNLNSLIYKNPRRTVDLLNKSRDAFERFVLPIAFVVNTDNLKKIINGAPDFYQLRDLPDFHFEGFAESVISERLFDKLPQADRSGYENLDLKADLLEEQLKILAREQKINEDVLNSFVVPLLEIYIDKSYYNKMKALFNQYLKGKEGKIEDKQVLDNYYAAMSEVENTFLYSGEPLRYKKIKEILQDKQEKERGDILTPRLLDKKLGYLTKPQRQLLDVLSIYRNPAAGEAIMAQNIVMNEENLEKLEDLSLIECTWAEKSARYCVPRLTAQYLLEQMDEEIKKQYHIRAAEFLEAIRDEEGKKYLDNDIEARWHYLQADHWNKAALITFSLESYLTHHGWSQGAIELLLELELSKLSEKNHTIALHRIGILFQLFGEYEKALSYFQKALEIDEKNNDKKGVSYSLHHIGMIYQDKGDYDAALTHYQSAKEVFEKIGDIKGVSKSLHQIGMVYQHKGDYKVALTHYQKSMEIEEKIGDIKGVSKNLLSIGTIYQERSEYEAALTNYKKAKEMFKKIGEIRGISSSLHQIGRIYQVKDDYDKALIHYRESMKIDEKIGDIKGISSSLHQIGMIYQDKGDYDAALTHYQKAMEIAEKIGDIDQAARSMAQMGMLYFKQSKFESALKLFIQAFLVFVKIGSPNANQAKQHINSVREKLPEESFNAILNEFNLPLDFLDKMEAAGK